MRGCFGLPPHFKQHAVAKRSALFAARLLRKILHSSRLAHRLSTPPHTDRAIKSLGWLRPPTRAGETHTHAHRRRLCVIVAPVHRLPHTDFTLTPLVLARRPAARFTDHWCVGVPGATVRELVSGPVGTDGEGLCARRSNGAASRPGSACASDLRYPEELEPRLAQTIQVLEYGLGLPNHILGGTEPCLDSVD